MEIFGWFVMYLVLSVVFFILFKTKVAIKLYKRFTDWIDQYSYSRLIGEENEEVELAGPFVYSVVVVSLLFLTLTMYLDNFVGKIAGNISIVTLFSIISATFVQMIMSINKNTEDKLRKENDRLKNMEPWL